MNVARPALPFANCASASPLHLLPEPFSAALPASPPKSSAKARNAWLPQVRQTTFQSPFNSVSKVSPHGGHRAHKTPQFSSSRMSIRITLAASVTLARTMSLRRSPSAVL